MKTIINIFFLAIMACSTSKNAVQEIQNMNIDEAYFQKWVAGIQGGGSGVDVYITFKSSIEEGLLIEKLQWKNVETTVIEMNEEKNQVIARLKTPLNQMRMDGETEKEYGNEVPVLNETLADGQVKLFFKKEGKIFYKLIENVKEKPMIPYPSMEKSKN